MLSWVSPFNNLQHDPQTTALNVDRRPASRRQQNVQSLAVGHCSKPAVHRSQSQSQSLSAVSCDLFATGIPVAITLSAANCSRSVKSSQSRPRSSYANAWLSARAAQHGQMPALVGRRQGVGGVDCPAGAVPWDAVAGMRSRSLPQQTVVAVVGDRHVFHRANCGPHAPAHRAVEVQTGRAAPPSPSACTGAAPPSTSTTPRRTAAACSGTVGTGALTSPKTKLR